LPLPLPWFLLLFLQLKKLLLKLFMGIWLLVLVTMNSIRWLLLLLAVIFHL
jgi:hypothetical protein